MKNTITLATAAALMLTTAMTSAQAADLRVSWWGGDARHAATQQALEVCGDIHGHNISPEFTGFDGHLERLTTQLAGRTSPDLMQVNWPWLPLFSPDGTGLADLNEFSDIIDLSQWDQALLDTGMRNGALNGLPVSITGRVLFYNADTYAEAGVEPPATWDDMIAAAETFKSELGDSYFPFSASRYNAMLLVSLYATQQTGVGFIDPETNEVNWDQATLAEAINFYQSLVDAGAIKSWETDAAMGNPGLHERGDWAAGEIGSSYEWDTTVSQIAGPWGEDHPLIPVMPPRVEGAVSDGIFRKPSMMFAISASSPNQEAAAEILNCLMLEEEGVRIMESHRGIPAAASAVALLEQEGLIDANVKAANDLVLAADTPPASPYFEDPAVRTAFEGVLEEYAYGLLSAEDAAAEIIRGTEQALRRVQ
ncbi:ABC transporter substrate-binding protein [Pelagibacterium luteolum]|uniref:Oligogalacturonide transport system substrate-binding protein n=1 Tax=Pelagibacterium luteolum TaxID=440168 RepID=A0A1G8AQR6_9HYPH|nr:ABC transporter substrate-binding protein [Pelagibacterium luteolum]SDH23259.1 oligogalacturonide transport system substrate-binding protein [Pelagibacterium luteolum]